MSVTCQTIHRLFRLIALWTLSLGQAALVMTLVSAEGHATAATPDLSSAAHRETPELAWVEFVPIGQRPPVKIWFSGQRTESGADCYVITHGMGGTAAGDRFHQLAAAIRQRFPLARVLRVDWSERASAKIVGFPCPWKVAASIDEVGDQAASLLQSEAIDPANTTFIGESFGNWVNARIARQLGGVQGILALNPANEAGGYTPPDLRKRAKRSRSFHTYSAFDTTLEIAEGDYWLQTPARATHWEQHVSGIAWLSNRIAAGDLSWLRMDETMPERKAGCFQALATLDGQVSSQQVPRQRPIPADENQDSAGGMTKESVACE